MNTEELFKAGKNIPQEQVEGFARIIDIKVGTEMQQVLAKMDSMERYVHNRMDSMETYVHSRMDSMDKRMDKMDGRIDRMDNTMRWGFGIIITLMIALKFLNTGH
jgi:hypothetical protein